MSQRAPMDQLGAVHFEMEAIGQPSRWNTLRAARVMAAYKGTGG